LSYENLVVDQCDSTNDLARSSAEQGAPHGTWISARIQDSGRGRHGRKWQSIEGNLFLSLIIRIEDQHRWSWIPLTTAVGVVRYLRKKFPVLNVQIKWPNDIYLTGRKLGGILCESVNGPQPFIIVGIGLNCMASPEGPDLNGIDLTTLLNGKKISSDSIRLELISSVLKELNELATEGPGTIARCYQKWSVLSPGTEIHWNQNQESGIVQGLGPSGELEVLMKENKIFSLYAEDISLTKEGSPEDREDPGAS
jgi:BirA family biotin operon repressor/biotin-[acetyl-CoA-carboxylase] ligase